MEGSRGDGSGMRMGDALASDEGDSSGAAARFLGLERSAATEGAVPSDAESALRKLAMERYLRRSEHAVPS